MSILKHFVLISTLFLGTGAASAQSAPSTPPAAVSSSKVQSPVTETDIQKFIAVRQAEKDALGDSFSSLQAIFQDIKNGNNPGFLQVTQAFGRLGGSVGEARAAQKQR